MKRCQPWGNSKTCESTPGTPAWGNRKKASRGGDAWSRPFGIWGGWGVQGTFLVSKARETFPQDPWDGQGRKAYALPLGLCRKTSFCWTALPGQQSLQNCAREHTHSCFFQQYLTIIQKNDRLLGKRLFTYPILRSFFSYKLLCAKDIVLRKQGSKCPVSHEKVMNVQNVTISW